MPAFNELITKLGYLMEAQQDSNQIPDYEENEVTSWLEWIYEKKCHDEAIIASIKERIADLQGRKLSLENRLDNLKQMAFVLLKASGQQKVKLPEFTAYIGASRPSVNITDEAALSDEYVVIKKQPNKTLIKEHILNGVIVEGAELSEETETIVIRSK
jgi:hypothetical protein